MFSDGQSLWNTLCKYTFDMVFLVFLNQLLKVFVFHNCAWPVTGTHRATSCTAPPVQEDTVTLANHFCAGVVQRDDGALLGEEDTPATFMVTWLHYAVVATFHSSHSKQEWLVSFTEQRYRVACVVPLITHSFITALAEHHTQHKVQCKKITISKKNLLHSQLMIVNSTCIILLAKYATSLIHDSIK